MPWKPAPTPGTVVPMPDRKRRLERLEAQLHGPGKDDFVILIHPLGRDGPPVEVRLPSSPSTFAKIVAGNKRPTPKE